MCKSAGIDGNLPVDPSAASGSATSALHSCTAEPGCSRRAVGHATPVAMLGLRTYARACPTFRAPLRNRAANENSTRSGRGTFKFDARGSSIEWTRDFRARGAAGASSGGPSLLVIPSRKLGAGASRLRDSPLVRNRPKSGGRHHALATLSVTALPAILCMVLCPVSVTSMSYVSCTTFKHSTKPRVACWIVSVSVGILPKAR